MFIGVALLLHAILGGGISGVSFNPYRFFSHYLILLLLVLLSFVVKHDGDYFLNVINKTLMLFFYSFPVILITAALGIVPVHSFGVNYSKPMFPFQEPSHYYNFLTLCSIVYAQNKGPSLVLVIFLVSLTLYPSATGLAGFGVFILYLLMKSNINFMKLLTILVALLLSIFTALEMLGSYYLDRVLFWNSSNLSALVYLQGMESAYLGFIKSLGVGVGLGQMSDIVIQTNTAQKILDITGGVHFNIFSGSFLLSQLVAEFGIFGFCFVFYLVYILMNSRKALRGARLSEWLPPALILSSMCEVFIRGYGLLSPIMILCYIGIIIKIKLDKTYSKKGIL
ncbi:hypothetical protein [Pseudoalteromonas sp. CAL260-MNA-CIBAN-0059]|uniref:hypothetical protein n=1 Tax=Pseudoalteromonas sp. CAL260-MNA-CIBAN-0059 TaxID=3140430 RepID=UPI00331D9E08